MGRPVKDFNDFIGQSKIIDHAKRFIAGCHFAGAAFPSCMLIGPSGFGKTALAESIARGFGTDIHKIFAGSGIKPVEVCQVLAEVKFGDFVFIDEVHSLDRDCQQLLYLALDERRIPTIAGRKLLRTTTQSVAEFTLIVATNLPGKIQKALVTRLKRFELEPYSPTELRGIADRVARKSNMDMSGQAVTVIAETCQGTPRYISSRIESLKLYWPGLPRFSNHHVYAMLAGEGIGELGTTAMQRRYLELLLHSRVGCSLSRLAAQLGCDAAYIRDSIEPYLAQLGFVEFHGGQGRMITVEGREFITTESSPLPVVEEGETACLPS